MAINLVRENMSEQRQVKDWITIKGNHIPIYEGESKQDAVNRYTAKSNEDKKQTDIAKNKQEADRLNGKQIKGLTVNSSPKEMQNYYKKNYNISIDDSYFNNGNDVRFIVDSSKELDKLYSEFPQLKVINPKIISNDFDTNDDVIKQFKNAIALSDKHSDDIFVNSKKFSDYDTLKERYAKRVKDGIYPENTTVADVLIHELGHKLEYILAKKLGLDERAIQANSTASAIVNRAYEKMREQFKEIQDARDSISKYSGKNYSILEDSDLPAYEETFAEAVSDFISDSRKAKPFSKQIIMLIRAMLVTG